MSTATGKRLLREAQRFADDLSDLLNRTVTTGVRISSVLHPTGTCWVAPGITASNLTARRGIPIRLGRRAPSGYLLVAQILELDSDDHHLITTKSVCGLYADADLDQPVVRYDYERQPDNPYPPAHVQIAGQSPAVEELCRRSGQTKELKDLHFPVGGHRFRPTLEDLIEFVIVERFTTGHDQWRQVVDRHRRKWEELQLRAAVRRLPAVARKELERLADSEK